MSLGVPIAHTLSLFPLFCAREHSPLRAQLPPALEQETTPSPLVRAARRGSRAPLAASSPSVLVAHDDLDLEAELAELMTMPKLPFEIIEEYDDHAEEDGDESYFSPSAMSSSDHKLPRAELLEPQTPAASLSLIEKSQINHDTGKGIIKWCSWCFQYAPQKKLEARWMGRNAHECGHCLNETCVCLMCSEGACRSYGGSADKLCFKCDGSFSKARVTAAMKLEGRCSWCLEKQPHTLHKSPLVLGRNVYNCDGCGKRTVLCTTCNVSFARGSEGLDGMDEELCVLCSHTIDNWDQALEARSNSNAPAPLAIELDLTLSRSSEDESVDGWCSWCVEDTRHELVGRSLLTRNTFRCSECQHRTLCCLQCRDGMSRSGVGYDDKTCVSCHLKLTLDSSVSSGTVGLKPWDWIHLKEKKDAVFDPERYTHARIMTLLSLASPFKDEAFEGGMIRPFLILVSMRPAKRNRVSNELGWSCIPSPLFGDAHAESWDIISNSSSGLQMRLTSLTEKVNVFSRSVTWLEALERVTLLFGKLADEVNMVSKLTPDGCIEESRRPYSRCVIVQEQVLMTRIGRLYFKFLLANHLKPPQGEKASAILNKIKDATGMSDSYGLTWATSIFFKPKAGMPKFGDALDIYLTSREDSQTARALLVCLEIIKQLLRLYIGFSVFVDDFYQ